MASREAPGAGRTGPMFGACDRGGVGQGWVVWSGAGRGRGGGARGSGAREREEQEKERASLGTILTYVCRTDTSADEHKRASLRGGRVGFKTDERNLKYEL
jgi:hypothetical protein